MKAIKIIIKLSFFAFIMCIILGGLSLFYSINKIGSATSKLRERIEILETQHTKELSGSPNVVKTYSNIEGIKVIVDNYVETDDTITIDIIVDTSDFTKSESFTVFYGKDEIDIPDRIVEWRDEFGFITADVITFDTDFNDEEFYSNLLNECFTSSYDLGKHFKDIRIGLDDSSDYGFLISEPVRVNNIQTNGLLYNYQRKFTLILNKANVQMVRLKISYDFPGVKSSSMYMLINDNY